MAFYRPLGEQGDPRLLLHALGGGVAAPFFVAVLVEAALVLERLGALAVLVADDVLEGGDDHLGELEVDEDADLDLAGLLAVLVALLGLGDADLVLCCRRPWRAGPG